ncbi:MAG: URC4/urg3 family protein [Caulobacterales bacterium]|nr:URC4/urg3 family protein [Caulobacterales bacterium]
MISLAWWAVTSKTSDRDAARALLSAGAVRARANEICALAEADKLEYWRLNADALPACADFVAEIVRTNYPSLAIPFHARWRHFVFNGRDLWAETANNTAWISADARARAEFDLAITSVLLDAGAGAAWRYRDDLTDIEVARSEGLALASLRLFEWGGFSADPRDPLRADAEALARFDAQSLGDAFQVSERNPLAGLDGRARLLNRLGHTVDAHPHLFALADGPRPGGLYDLLRARVSNNELPAPVILEALLTGLGPIWENRPSLGGVPLGDCWDVPGLGFVPLHKLSQWLAYSLIEPLERAGVRVTDIDGLTGLAEYRNGGLFIDAGVLELRDAAALARVHDVSDPLVVTWRSMIVALLDRIAPLVRERLGVTADAFPLARVLEGGTWAAGRAIAKRKRADGGPPLLIHSDGTVF